MELITEFDFTILRAIRENLSCEFLDFLMPKITMLGEFGAVWIVIALAFLSFKKTRRNGIAMSAALLAGVLIGNLLIKNLVARDRPCWIDESVTMLIAVPHDFSFPSGHTTASFAAAVVILHQNWKAGIGAYVVAVLIAFSRMYLYVHFPTDILAGVILGTVLGIAAFKITDVVAERIKQKHTAS